MKKEIFISHSHKDYRIVEQLTNLIKGCFKVESSQIVCSSVEGYKLPHGEQISSNIRGILMECSVVIGVISPDSLKSNYVNFELGVGWYLEKAIAVIDSRVNFGDVPGPLKEHNGLQINNTSDISALIDYISKKSELETESTSLIQKQVDNFSKNQKLIERSYIDKQLVDIQLIGGSNNIMQEVTDKLKLCKSIIRKTTFGKTLNQTQPSPFIDEFNSILKKSIEIKMPIEVRIAHSKDSDIKGKDKRYNPDVIKLFQHKKIDVENVIFNVIILDDYYAQIAFPSLNVDEHFRTCMGISDKRMINELILWFDSYLWTGNKL